MTKLTHFKYFAISILTISFLVFISISRWDKNYTHQILFSDSASYYAYLPALFIHKDLSFNSFKFFEQVPKRFQFRPRHTQDKKKINKFTMGVAAAQIPFFLIAYLTATDKDFYISEHFQFFIGLSGLFYSLLGILILWHVLVRFVSPISATFTCFTLFFSTNLYYQTFYDPGFSHVYTFFTLSLLSFFIIKENLKVRDFYISSFLIGCLILIRPINFWFVVILFFPFYCHGKKLWKLLFRPKVLMLNAVLMFIPLLPQLLYYYYITGSLIYDTYPDEHFYFTDPQYIKGLFSFRNGLITYTPIYLLVIPSFIITYKRNIKLFHLVCSVFMIHLYLLVTWWAWWWCCGYSLRPMVDILPLIGISNAYFFNYMTMKKIILYPTVLFILTVTFLNVFQSHQQVLRIIHQDGMTYEAYKEVFLKLNISPEEKENVNNLIRRPDYRLNPKGIGR